MADRLIPQSWRMCALYLAASATIVFGALLPLGPGAGRLPGPDLLVLLAFAWVLRRPDHVPVLALAAVMFVADLLTMRPPGLWAMMMLIGVEATRGRTGTWSDMPFLVEWAVVSAVLAAMHLAYAIGLAVFFVDQPPIGQTLIRLIATICFYPAVVFVVDGIFRVKRAPQAAISGRPAS